MGKYKEQQKLSAVEDYCRGQAGLRAVAQRHGIDVSSLRKWVAAYRAHGAAAMQEKHRAPYDAEFKLVVLQRMRADDLSYRQVAALFDIRNFNIIGDWARAYDSGGLAALTPYFTRRKTMTKQLPSEPEGKLRADEQRTRQELLDELNYLRMENAYLKKRDALAQASIAPRKKRKSCSS